MYCHGEAAKGKLLEERVGSYVEFTNLYHDTNTFWSVKWEMRVDRNLRISRPEGHRKTDHWMQPVESVLIKTLHVIGRKARHMHSGGYVIEEWNPIHEANPVSYAEYFEAARKSRKMAEDKGKRWTGINPSWTDEGDRAEASSERPKFYLKGHYVDITSTSLVCTR